MENKMSSMNVGRITQLTVKEPVDQAILNQIKGAMETSRPVMLLADTQRNHLLLPGTDLFDVYDRHALSLGLKLEIYHSSIIDWRITVEKQNKIIIDVQHSDYKYALAKAEVELKDWLSENIGGY
ncbi:hypothetical protein [Paenibacillus tyrfis]|uniref:hypothetical protein n=1 Tax=Paenibacillus tyrfis TaxID=1501230 RepID=UPI000B596D84|nr:hypothetical protein [Paenibacillus tyrfis]